MRRSVLLAGSLGALAVCAAVVAPVTSYAATSGTAYGAEAGALNGHRGVLLSYPAPTGNVALEAEVTRLVNVERTVTGCDPLTVDDRLGTAARKHSTDMAMNNYFSHTSRDGTDFATRITRERYTWSWVGENIAKGQRTPADVMNSWMDSPGHRANILNCGFRDIGVGVAADSDGTLLWTQDFGSQL